MILPLSLYDDSARFSNALKILMSLDKHELVDGGVIDEARWPAFRDYPFRTFLRLNDDEKARCWALIETRQRPKFRSEIMVPA